MNDLDAVLVEEIRAAASLDIPADASFFEAGLTSATVVQIHERLQRRLGRRFPVQAFFKHVTRSALAAYLATGDAGPAPVETTTAAGGWTPQARRALRARIRQQRQGNR